MEVYLPLADIHIAWPVLVALGLLVGILQGFFGVGGGWLTTPTLNILGFPIVYAIGTDLAFTAASAVVGAARHFRLGNLDVRLAGLVGVSGIVGVEAARRLVLHLEQQGLAEASVRLAYAVLLCFVGALILRRELRRPPGSSSRPSAAAGHEALGGWARRLDVLHSGPKVTLADGSPAAVSALIFAGLATGSLAGFLGTGGGFVLVPVLVYGLGVTSRVAVAASLLSIAITNGFGTLGYGSAGKVELLAAGVMFAGASVGTQVGATATRIVKQHDLQTLLGLTLVAAGGAVLLRQADQHAASAVVMFGAASAMAAVIVGLLLRGPGETPSKVKSAE